MPAALLFIDGVGVGSFDPDINPLARHELLLSQFVDHEGVSLPRSGAVTPVDTTFGVPGRPQSASNQTAILTGEPAPKLIGRHVLGFPNPPLREILAAKSIVKTLVQSGRSATFANSYPAGYLDALGLRRRESKTPDVVIPQKALRKIKASATTLAMAAGDVALRTLEDAREGRGLTNDIDGRRGRKNGFPVPSRSPEEAAEIFLELTRTADFTLFEHYLADEAGHAQDFDAAEDALKTFDAFARAVIANMPDDLHLLICSDHGNVEDLSTRSHTLNRVPVLYFGPERDAVTAQLRDVADVGRVLLSLAGGAA